MRLPTLLTAGLATLVVAAPAAAAEQTTTGTFAHTWSQQALVADGKPLGDFATTVLTMPVTHGAGALTDVTVRLDKLTHANPDDLDIQLVAPDGRQVTLMSDAGGQDNITGQSLTFRAGAPALPDSGPLVSGTYGPTDYGLVPETWGGGCTPSTERTTLAGLRGGAFAGTWKLCIVDDDVVDIGSLGNWHLDLTTTGTRIGDPAYGSFGPAHVYPAPLAVDAPAAPVTGIELRLQGVEHERLSDLDVVLQAPDGRAAKVLSDASGVAFAGELVLSSRASELVPLAGVVPGRAYAATDRGDVADVMPNGAPDGPGSFAALLGAPANGTWKLYVNDEQQGKIGELGGWQLALTTGTPDPPATVAPGAVPAPSPAPRATLTPRKAKLAVGPLRPTVKRSRVRVKFTLSGPAKVVVKLERRAGRKHRRVTSTTASGRKGTNTVALRRRLTPGTYRLTVQAGAAKRTVAVKVRR